MAEQKIEFRKIRDFGENLNDTFLFIRQNFTPLVKSFFAICAVFMLIQAIFNGIYQSQSLNVLDEIFKGRQARARTLNRVFNLEYFMMILFMLLTIVSMKVALGAYIKYYVENNGKQPGIEEVWGIFKKYFFKVVAYSIPINIAIIAGCIFCLIPGFFLWVVFVPFIMVVMIEDANFIDSYHRCFELIKENFWMSFAVYIVAYLIYSFSGGIVGAVASLIVGFGAYFTTDNLSTTIGIATSFLNIFSFCFYIIFFVCVAFHYFNLVEKRDGTGILSRIDSIGNDRNNFKNIEEQY